LSLAEAQIKQNESAEMQFYAGMAEASAARLYGLRGENRNTARSGCADANICCGPKHSILISLTPT